MSAATQYADALRSAPPRGGGLHQHVMRVACLGVLAELAPETICNDLHALEGVRKGEPEDAVAKAGATVNRDYEAPKPRPIHRFAPKTVNPLESFIKGVSCECMDLMEMSPTRLIDDPSRDGATVLKVLYKPDEVLFIGDTFSKAVRTVKAWLTDDLAKYPHIIPNPMSGLTGMTGTGNYSFRCEETVKDLRYAVCEMDEVPIDKQTAFWIRCIQIGIPVSAVIHSGSKSLHGWVKVDCGADGDKWDKLVREGLFEKFGRAYGLDNACKTRARLSRLAGHQRAGKEQQRLLYLNGDV